MRGAWLNLKKQKEDGASTHSKKPHDSEDELDSSAGILKQTRVAINLWQTLQKSNTPGGQQFVPVPVVQQTREARGQKREQMEQEEKSCRKKQRVECACCLQGNCVECCCC